MGLLFRIGPYDHKKARNNSAWHFISHQQRFQ